MSNKEEIIKYFEKRIDEFMKEQTKDSERNK